MLRDEVDALLDRRQHPEPEQVDLEEAGVGARVLVPLAHLPPLHRRRLDGDELDERARRDDHPAGVLGDVPRQAGDLGAERAERAPARRLELARGVGERRDLVGDALRVPAVGQAREPLEVGVRQAERLADVADRAARAVRRERRDERRVLGAVALDDADDELLPDVAREVEVDVGDGRELAVEEAAEREVVRDRIDVREAGEVTDERADRRAAPAARRQDVAHRARPAHLERDLPRELEHFPVEQEEAGEAELADEVELLLEPLADALLVAVEVRVPLGERGLADAAELDDRGLRSVGEVGIAVAELFGQIELETLRESRLCAAPRRGRRGSGRALRRAREAPPRGCRAAPARSLRARCGSERRRGCPAARRGDGRARGRLPSRRSGRRASPRARAGARCGARRRARTDAAARRRSGRGRRRARAAPLRSGRAPPSRRARSRTSRRARRSAPPAVLARAMAASARGSSCRACARAPPSTAGRGSRSRSRSRRAASRASLRRASPPPR